MGHSLKVSILIALFTVTTYSFASPITKCPSVNAIKSLGLTKTDIVLGYEAYNTSSYDTNQLWTFALGFFDAQSAEEALKIGNEWLLTLSGNPTPVYTAPHSAMCNYEMGHEGFAVASTSEAYS